ncbi:MAG: B12-binding domain-containing radical SAM protein, partial [Candidatus Omnitrophica bacterium]|nr:B12-binding domain-containing radical SAM protein [Candidatus Omnitrophota bacterium]
MKIKFVMPPAFDETKLSMLPYGMCVLVGYLRGLGFEVAQADIMIKIRRKNIPRSILGDRPFNINLARNPNRMAGYLFGQKEDLQLDNLSKDIVSLENFAGFDIVGISVHSIFQFPFALLMAKYIKKTYNPTIIMGGPFITLRGVEFMKKAQFVDFMVRGEGEIPLKSLLNSNSDIKNLYAEDIPGLAYRKGNEVLANKRASLPAEEMSPPDFGGLNLDLYRYVINGKPEVIFTYQFTKGCRGRCCFCTHHIVSDVLETKSPEKVARELKEICAKYNAKYFYICDSTVNPNYVGLKKICDAIKKEGPVIAWGSLAKLDNMTEDLAKSLKDSGCKFLRFGFESGSNRILKMMGKAHTTDSALASIKNTHKYGIKNLGTFISGFPGENNSDIALTRDFIKRISPYVFELSCGICCIEPGSPMRDNPERFGMKNLQVRDREFIDYEEFPRNAYKFEEINGLSWKDKRLQQISSQKEVIKTIKKYVVNIKEQSKLRRLIPVFLYTLLGENKYRFD